MRSHIIVVFILTLAGFVLRLHYLIITHPFFDEFTTVLAAREILRRGWPVLPSGLFYEHGLLATYVIAPFTALFINMPLSQWQTAHWGLMLSRWPSVLIGTATIPVIYTLGRHGFNASGSPIYVSRLTASIAILAAGLFAFSPEGMVWGGRARMYALATLLVLLTVYWAYRGAIHPAPAKYRWWAIFALLAALLTQLGVLTLILPLVTGMVVVGWLSARERQAVTHDPHSGHTSRAWFLRSTVLLEVLALVVIVGLALLVKRLGRPLGTPILVVSDSAGLVEALLNTAAYQIAVHFTWPDTVRFLSRQFGVPHHLWLTIVAGVGAVIGLTFWLLEGFRKGKRTGNEGIANRAGKKVSSDLLFLISPFSLFLWLVFGLIIVEMVSLLDPFRRNPRYIVMYLPLFYLIAAEAIFNFRHVARFLTRLMDKDLRLTAPVSRFFSLPVAAIVLLVLFTAISLKDLRVALTTPEPAYEEGLAFVQANWQPGDTLLTMNTPAAGLYLGHADGFTVQDKAEQFLLNADTAPVDRWLGVPWLGSAADFNTALNASERVWFVIDTVRQPVYFRGDWLAVVNNQMEQVWARDNALVYRTRPDRPPFSSQPDTYINVTLGDSIELVGYTLANSPNSELRLTLFWQPLVVPLTDYTTFLHLRNQEGITVAQWDGQPLAGAYPTSHWQPGEIVIDPIDLPLPADLPAGNYSLFTGLYQLDTLERLPVANDTSGEHAILLGEVVVSEQ